MPEQDVKLLRRLLQLSDGSFYSSSLPMTKSGDDEYYGGMLEASHVSASRPSRSSGSSGSGWNFDLSLSDANTFMDSAAKLATATRSKKSGGARAADYTARMVNEYLLNPERALATYNKNTDLSNSYFQNYMNALTGNGLTQSQIEQNQFNAEQAQAQRDWATEMASTSYQRTTSDMKAAGLNPAMMYGSNASPSSVPNGSAASGNSSAALGIGAIAELITAAAQSRLARSTSALNMANSFKSIAESRLISNQAKTEEGRPFEISSRISLNDAKIEEAKAQAKLATEKADSEDERRSLMLSQAMLNNANANNISAMLPFMKDYYSAKSKEARAHASYLAVEEAYKQGLIDEKVIKSIVELNNSHASEADQRAEAIRIDTAFRKGDFSAISDNFFDQTWYGLERTLSLFKGFISYSDSNSTITKM